MAAANFGCGSDVGRRRRNPAVALADGDGLSVSETFERHRDLIEKISSDRYDAASYVQV